MGSRTSVHDARTSRRLLDDPGTYTYSIQFSPDGSHFALFHLDGLWAFQCTPGSYTLLWKSLFTYRRKPIIQFSPTSSSILSQHDGILQVRRLSDLPIASKPNGQITVISRSGRSIATVRRSEATVTITDLHSRAPPQFIDTGFDVTELTITGNVLVAKGEHGAGGWLLTEEGMVDGLFDNRRASGSDSKWTVAPQIERCIWSDRVGGKFGAIQAGSFVIGENFGPLFYHTETGDVFESPPEPQHSSPETSPGTVSPGGESASLPS